MIRVFVLARSPADQQRLRSLVASPDIAVVGVASSVAALLNAQPDVAVIAADEWIADIGRAALPAVVLWTDEPGAVVRARRWRAGAWGVIARGASLRQLQAAVLAVAAGLCVVPAFGMPDVPAAANGTTDEEAAEIAEPLTPREREVLEAASRGISNREIGEALGISEHTVKFHLAATYGKLGVSTRTAAVRRGLRRGLIEI